MSKNIPHNRIAIKDRREKLWTLLTRGMKSYKIAKELNVDPSIHIGKAKDDAHKIDDIGQYNRCLLFY